MPRPATTGSPDHRRSSLLRKAVVALGVVAAAAVAAWFVLIPYPRGLDDRNPDRTALMEQRLAEARAGGVALDVRHEWVPLDEISPSLQRAVVVAEDYRFRQHGGIDWVSLAEEVQWTGDERFSWLSPSDVGALVRATDYVWSHRDEIRGRSTITQQLAKNLYFGTDRSLMRKAVEAVVARRLERRLSKDRILELYLNIAEWGPGIFGVEAASQAYFGRSARSLTLEQAATLAATLPHPLTSNPTRSPGRMLWRKELVLDRIDPSRGLPATPMPLTEPALDLGLALPEPELAALDSSFGLPAVAGPDSVRVSAQSLESSPRPVGDSSLVRDSSALRDSSLPRDSSLVRDSTVVRDTVFGRDTLSPRKPPTGAPPVARPDSAVADMTGASRPDTRPPAS